MTFSLYGNGKNLQQLDSCLPKEAKQDSNLSFFPSCLTFWDSGTLCKHSSLVAHRHSFQLPRDHLHANKVAHLSLKKSILCKHCSVLHSVGSEQFFLNNAADYLKFTYNYSETHINYLDVESIRNGEGFKSVLYRKPTYSNDILHYSRCHPIAEKSTGQWRDDFLSCVQ